jgi:hypothetical protein
VRTEVKYEGKKNVHSAIEGEEQKWIKKEKNSNYEISSLFTRTRTRLKRNWFFVVSDYTFCATPS